MDSVVEAVGAKGGGVNERETEIHNAIRYEYGPSCAGSVEAAKYLAGLLARIEELERKLKPPRI